MSSVILGFLAYFILFSYFLFKKITFPTFNILLRFQLPLHQILGLHALYFPPVSLNLLYSIFNYISILHECLNTIYHGQCLYLFLKIFVHHFWICVSRIPWFDTSSYLLDSFMYTAFFYVRLCVHHSWFICCTESNKFICHFFYLTRNFVLCLLQPMFSSPITRQLLSSLIIFCLIIYSLHVLIFVI